MIANLIINNKRVEKVELKKENGRLVGRTWVNNIKGSFNAPRIRVRAGDIKINMELHPDETDSGKMIYKNRLNDKDFFCWGALVLNVNKFGSGWGMTFGIQLRN